MAGDRINTYVVRALLEDKGPARVMDGSFVLMDIAAAQLAFARLGRIDRLDVQIERAPTALDASRAPTSDDLDAAAEAIGKRLPAGLTAARPSRRGQQVERMLAAFHLNLSALSWVALVVGLFLVYNTATVSVLARRDEVGMLRALGVTRRQVLGLFLGEAAVMGLAGAALGLGLGRLLADLAVGVTGATVSTIYIATAAAPPALGWAHVVLALLIGVPLSLLAATVPALEASRVPPTAAMRGADRLETRVRLRPRTFVVPLVVLAAALGLAQLGPVNGMPLFGYLAAFVTIIGAALLVPALVYGMARMVRAPLRRLLGVEGVLAHAHLSSAIPRLSISIAALSVSLAMMVAVAVMIGSFRDTVNLLGGPDAAGRPLRRSRRAAHDRLGPVAVPLGRGGDFGASRRGRRRHLPQSRSRSTRATWWCSAPGGSTWCCRTAPCSSRSPPMAAPPWPGPWAPMRSSSRRPSPIATAPGPATPSSWPPGSETVRSRSWPFTTTTPWTAAWW